WTALVLALRGDAAGFDHLIEAIRPALLTIDRRWGLQGIAEGRLYLGQFEGALSELALLDDRPAKEPDPDPGQLAWAPLTAGMALREVGRLREGEPHLYAALALGRRRWDTVIQGFALASYAGYVLDVGQAAGPPHSTRAAEDALELLRDGYF